MARHGSNIDWTAKDTKVLQVLANVLAGQNRHDKAVQLLEYALDKEPDNASIKKALSGAYLFLGRSNDALDMADAALATETSEADRERLLLVRSRALWQCGQTDEARAEMQHYINQRRSA